jgi:hypothetical protein
MRRLAWTILLVAGGALAAADDPSGTTALEIEVGEIAPVAPAPPGATVLCDDLHVVVPEFTGDGNGFVLRALHPGSTLCGLWLAGQKPGGLYRVHVVAKKADPKIEAPKAPPDAGVVDAGG